MFIKTEDNRGAWKETRYRRPKVAGLAWALLLAAALGWLGLPSNGSTAAPLQQPPSQISFARDIIPILQENCLGCHNRKLESGGLVMESFDDLMKGGESGPAIIAGRSGESRMVLMLEGKVSPRMPLQGELKPAQIAAIKAWIDGGARPPEPGTAIAAALQPNIPNIKPKVPVAPEVSALSFRPDGGILAVAGYREVKLVDALRGTVTNKLLGPKDFVRALAYSPDAKWLVAGGGAPARGGEITIWNATNGELVRVLKGHTDYIYATAFSPDSKLLATSSYDKLVKLWDITKGREVKTLKDHIDAVFPVAFSPDGKWLASGSADRTVKLWDVSSGKRLFTLSDALDAIYALAFHPSGEQISAAGADKTIRTWNLTADAGTLARSIVAHEDTIIQLAYSPDGKTLVSTGSDRLIKIWDAQTGLEIKMLEEQPDWPMAVAFTPDGRRLAVGRYDGSVSIYEVATTRRVLDPIRIAITAQVGDQKTNPTISRIDTARSKK